MSITGGAYSICNLKNLEELTISNGIMTSELTDLSLKHLSELHFLRKLKLEITSIKVST